jgi:predicted porin
MKLMKNRLLLITVIGLAAGNARAQNSVTLYGVADSGVTFTSNAAGAHQVALTSGNNGTSRWGLAGSEDLGSGLKAVFTLEDGYIITTGKIGVNGTEFGRQAFVGLTDNSYGTLTLGRQYSAAYMAVGPLSAGGNWAAIGAGYGTHPGDVDNLDSSNRVANSIKYQSPTFGGITLSGLYGLGGQAGDLTQNEVIDFGATYASGPVNLAAGYLFTKDPNYSFWGNKANDSTTGSNIVSPVNSGYATAGAEQIISIAGTYALGRATIGLVYSNTQFKHLGSVAVADQSPIEDGYRGTVALNIGEVNFTYQLTPALLLGTAYSYTRNGGASNQGSGHYQQVDIGAIYAISKRTSLYAFGVYQTAAGTDSTGEAAVAAITAATPSSTNHQMLATVGMTHRF